MVRKKDRAREQKRKVGEGGGGEDDKMRNTFHHSSLHMLCVEGGLQGPAPEHAVLHEQSDPTWLSVDQHGLLRQLCCLLKRQNNSSRTTQLCWLKDFNTPKREHGHAHAHRHCRDSARPELYTKQGCTSTSCAALCKRYSNMLQVCTNVVHVFQRERQMREGYAPTQF